MYWIQEVQELPENYININKILAYADEVRTVKLK